MLMTELDDSVSNNGCYFFWRILTYGRTSWRMNPRKPWPSGGCNGKTVTGSLSWCIPFTVCVIPMQFSLPRVWIQWLMAMMADMSNQADRQREMAGLVVEDKWVAVNKSSLPPFPPPPPPPPQLREWYRLAPALPPRGKQWWDKTVSTYASKITRATWLQRAENRKLSAMSYDDGSQRLNYRILLVTRPTNFLYVETSSRYNG